MKPRCKARIHESCRCPGIHQEREWPFAVEADVGCDRSATDDPYWHNRHRTGLRRTGFFEQGQSYAWDRGRRPRGLRLAAAPASDEGDDGDDNERMSSPHSSTHCVRSLLRPRCPILLSLATGACAVAPLLASTANGPSAHVAAGLGRWAVRARSKRIGRRSHDYSSSLRDGPLGSPPGGESAHRPMGDSPLRTPRLLSCQSV